MVGTMATLSRELPFIGGRRDDSHTEDSYIAVNPATGEELAEVTVCGLQHVDDAVAAGREAQIEWATWAPHRRGDVLWKWGDLIVDHARELAELDTKNMGKPIRDTMADTPGQCRLPRYWAGMADKIWGDQVPVTPGHLSYTVRMPIGVYGVILPWNGPVPGFVGRVSSAVACGNAVIVKPSEWSPLSAGLLAELCVEAGMPPGLVNVLPGEGATGAALASHPGVDGLSFTGSVATGRKIAHAAADTFKKLVLEMGGKSPNIVFADADLDAAVRGTTWGIFYNSGQVCCAGTRLLVQRGIADEFVARLAQEAKKVRMGDPMDPANHIGPIVCEKQFDRVNSYIRIGREEGAKVVVGEPVPSCRGYYVPPTIFSGVTSDMRIAQEEIFGPVLSVLTFEDEAEALEIANGVDYGLAAVIWTRDVGRMLRMADRVEAGTVWCNTMRLYDPALPFGGFKNSGLGNAYAEGAVEGATRTKRVSIRFDDSVAAPGWDDLT
jgi:acyl-CoA reductase-like NAD-dependent aldehyde dehydrogenase